MRCLLFLCFYCFTLSTVLAQYTPFEKLKLLYESSKFTECIDKSNTILEKNRVDLYPYFWQLKSYLAIHKLKYHEKQKSAYDKALNIAVKLKKKDSKSYFQETYPEVYEEIVQLGITQAKLFCQVTNEKAVGLYKKLLIIDGSPELLFAQYQCQKSGVQADALYILNSLINKLNDPNYYKTLSKDTFEVYYAFLAQEYFNYSNFYRGMNVCKSAIKKYKIATNCKRIMLSKSKSLVQVMNFETDVNSLKKGKSFYASIDSLYPGEQKEIETRLIYLLANRYLLLATNKQSTDAIKFIKQYITIYDDNALDTVTNFFNDYYNRNKEKAEFSLDRTFYYRTEITRFFQRASLFDAAKYTNLKFQEKEQWAIASDYINYCEKEFPKEKLTIQKWKVELNKKISSSIKSGKTTVDLNIPIIQSNAALKEAQLEQHIKSLNHHLQKEEFVQFAILIQKALALNPNNTKLLELKKRYIIADYKKEMRNVEFGSNFKAFDVSPSINKCIPGQISTNANSKVLSRINYLRRLAGIPDSSIFKTEYNKQCQAAALMMDANNTLEHSPPKSWKCFTQDGFLGASSGNLSLGHGFVESIMGQIEDFGSGNYACGHRRWILNPYNRIFGFGSTENASCLKVFGTSGVQTKSNFVYNDSQYVAWPSADYFPIALVPVRWSFSLPNADFSKAKVTVLVNGKNVKIAIEKLATGYALNTLVWQVNETVLADAVYTIQINNVSVRGNLNKKFVYKVVFLKIE